MAETEKTTTKKEEEKKSNPGVIIAICAAVVCIACVVIAIILGNGGAKKAIVGSWKYSGMDAVYTFNEDGTCSYKFYDNVRACTYTDNGDSIQLINDGATSAITYKYHIEDGKTLHIEDSFGQDVVYERQ